MAVSLEQMKIIFKVFIYIFLIWINGCFMEVSSEMNRMDQMQMVKDRIFKNYDKYISPTNGTNNTLLRTLYYPRQIIGLDEERALFSMDAYLLLEWYDLRLQWNVSDYDGYLKIPASEVWNPHIFVFNSHDQVLNPFEEVRLVLSPSGNVIWVPPMLTETQCPEISDAPYFKQEIECVIKIGYWMHDGWQVELDQSGLFLYLFQNMNSKWELITSKAASARNVTYIGGWSEEPFISFHLYFPMRRRPAPAIEATKAPCLLVMILTLTIFWLAPDSSMKLLIGGILFLVLNVLLVYVAVSLKAPLAVVFAVSVVRTAMYLVVVTILLQVFVVIKVSSMTGPSRPPMAIVQFLTGPFGNYACLRSPMSENTVELDQMQLKEGASTVKGLTANDEWRLFAAAIDRALFVVMSVVMVAVHHL